MALAAGHRIGPYEIVSKLGAGGMGEVYRARDTRLGREVALKILPASMSTDAVALARFEREAQAVAALSHPNVLALHDFGRDGEIAFAVMELLEGRSLAETLADGPLPFRRAVDVARQMAEGLAAAHERGIVHRDLKPGNIFLNNDGRVVILDFGLARRSESAPQAPSDATIGPATTPGFIVGTVGYMSPEQIRGQAVDHRSDVFSFGCVLYEMVSGLRAFKGTTPADVLSCTLVEDPADLVAGGVHVPAALDRIINRCLEKEASRRFQSTRDLAFAIEALSGESSSTMTPVPEAPAAKVGGRGASMGLLAVVAVAAAVLGATIALTLLRREPPAAQAAAPIIRFEVPAPAGEPSWVAISPDGQSVAWGELARESRRPTVAVRRLSGTSNITVSAAEGAMAGQFRRNSKDLFIGRRGELFSADPENNLLTPLLEAPAGTTPALRGSSIGPDEQILIGLDGAIVRIIAARPNETKVLASPDTKTHEWYGYPQWLPGGNRILFTARRAGGKDTDVLVMPVGGGAPSRLDLPLDITRVIVDPATGAIVYARGETLLGQRVDWTALKTTDEPVTLGAQVIADAATGALMADVSDSDELAFRRPGPRADEAPVNVIINWRQLLK